MQILALFGSILSANQQAEIQAKVEHIEGYVCTLIGAARVLDERRYLLEPLVTDDFVRAGLGSKFQDTHGARAYNHLVPLLAQDMIRDISRLILDSGHRVASLVNIHRKANVPKVHTALREKFSRIPEGFDHVTDPQSELTNEQLDMLRANLYERDRAEYGASFDDGWKVVTSAVAGIESDEVATKIKTFRDKYASHLQMTPLGQDPGPFDVASLGLSINDILQFQDRYMEPIFELTRIVTGQSYDVDGFREIHRRCGYDMWNILAGNA